MSDCADFAGATDADREVALTKRKEACHALYREYLIPLLRYVVSRAEVESGGEGLWFDRCEVVTSGTPAFMAAFDFQFNGALSRVHDAGFARAIERNVFIHTVSPGTVVFHDWRGERQNPNLGLVPAAVVMSRVVSLPAPGRITLDCGSKALACEAGDPAGYVIGKPEWEALACSEEHLPCVVRLDRRRHRRRSEASENVKRIDDHRATRGRRVRGARTHMSDSEPGHARHRPGRWEIRRREGGWREGTRGHGGSRGGVRGPEHSLNAARWSATTGRATTHEVGVKARREWRCSRAASAAVRAPKRSELARVHHSNVSLV